MCFIYFFKLFKATSICLDTFSFLAKFFFTELHPKSWTQDWRCSFFVSKLTREDKEIEINLIAVTPGSYRLPGTKIESMYNKDFRAYLKGFEVKVSQ